ncbi:hypothetical protein OAT18_00625 [Tenacibaculum sp.]|nr:hypothetical protein [Tenacibaculum sp.]
MKKSKLSLEKFSIVKLNNLSAINGGDDGLTRPKIKCVKRSEEWVKKGGAHNNLDVY